jgi:short-subunit dehydrogenase
VLTARRADELQREVRAIEAAGGAAFAVPADLADASEVPRIVDAAVETYGQVDVLVNNAGVIWSTSLAESKSEDVTHVLGINLLGAMLLTRAVLPGMLERRRGAIVCVGSLSGRVAMEPLYSAAKYGLRGFSLALRRQLAGSGVSVSLVSPGRIRTPMTRDVEGSLPEPELVAKTIANLVERPRREVVVPARHYVIAWLEQLLPSVADVVYRKRNWSPVG